MELPADFWYDIQGNETFKVEPFNEDNLVMVETKYGVKLPKDYVTFLGKQNGGFINYGKVRDYEDEIVVDRISGIGGSTYDCLDESDYYINEWELPHNILLFAGDGHWWLCFDYRKSNTSGDPVISYLDSETNRDLVIASTFDEFLSMLRK